MRKRDVFYISSLFKIAFAPETKRTKLNVSETKEGTTTGLKLAIISEGKAWDMKTYIYSTGILCSTFGIINSIC